MEGGWWDMDEIWEMRRVRWGSWVDVRVLGVLGGGGAWWEMKDMGRGRSVKLDAVDARGLVVVVVATGVLGGGVGGE